MTERLLYACSSNAGKLREFRSAAEGAPQDERFHVASLPDLSNISPPPENGSTFAENAASKALYYSTFTAELVFADDSGLTVDALGGAPGVYSARFAGDDASDEANNRLLLERMEHISDRSASFECAIALACAGGVLGVFSGSARGEILQTASAGQNGFGYDPLFFFPPRQQSFADLSPSDKWLVSHRGQAFRRMLDYLSNPTRESATARVPLP